MFDEIDLNKVHRYSIKHRKSKESIDNFPEIIEKTKVLSLIKSFPNVLKVKEFLELINIIRNAKKSGKPLIIGFGAHIIKTGCSQYFINLIRKGIVDCMVTNGASPIHDVEIALIGKTSEYVDEALPRGEFGFAREPIQHIAKALNIGSELGLGYGEAIGRYVADNLQIFTYHEYSIFYAAYVAKVPLTVHSAIGTEIIFQHPEIEGKVVGELSTRDFRIFANKLLSLGDGGVFVNFGSAVIVPEVFLKALSIAKNLAQIRNYYTANFDMYYHYRPAVNIIKRPTQDSGKGFYFIGHHEIMVPLFYYAVVEALCDEG